MVRRPSSLAQAPRALPVRNAWPTLEATAANFVGGKRAPCDAIILATGYRPQFQHIFAKNPEVFDATGLAIASDGPQAAPCLYFIGARPVATGQLREISGGARRIARSVKGELTAR